MEWVKSDVAEIRLGSLIAVRALPVRHTDVSLNQIGAELTINMWNTACPDWERRLMSGESLVPDLPLFKEEAERALRIFKRLRVPDMHGLPRMGASLNERAV